jgi:hypothetical protein
MKINNKYDILTPNGFEHFDGIQKLRKKTIEIFFDNGINLRGSYNHRVFDFDGNPILLSEIKPGFKIKSHDGFLTVNNIKKYYYETNVFDIVNSGIDHVFYSNDVLSHNCDFLGSGDGVIPNDIQENIAKNMIRTPIEKYMQGTLWQWKEPVNGHRYIMGVDVSRGDSEDFSSINIVDFDEREQVLEYIGKIPPDDLANIAYKWGVLYGNAFIVVDITGGMGVATSRKLQELNYKNIYIEGINTQNIWEYNSKAMEKIPGLNFNNKRTQIVAAFEEQLRKGFIVRSSRLLNELNTFVYINGRPDHMKGSHDDAIMSLSIALYAGDISFSQLQRTESVNKAMLESWVSSERTYETNKTFYSYGSSLDPIGSMAVDNSFFHRGNPLNVGKDSYNEYSWLFNKKKNL